jgi:Flp pilus assembly protein TadB
MDKYTLALQILAWLFIGYLVYLVIRYIKSLSRLNRLSYYSLNLENKKDKGLINNIIFKMSRILESLVIFNSLARTYDKYIYTDSKLRKGIDYISIKILLGIGLIFINLLINSLYKIEFSTLLILISFILGFIIPDFYCLFNKSKRVNILNKNLLSAIIIMNNSYKANESTEQAIKSEIDRTEGAVSVEFMKVLNDIKLGIDISEAFGRMYERTNLPVIKYISSVLGLVNKSGIDIIDAFSSIEKKLLEIEKFNNELIVLRDTNRLSVLLFSILPLVFLVTVIAYNTEYIKLLMNVNGIFIILIMFISYMLYLFIIKRIIRGDKYVK